MDAEIWRGAGAALGAIDPFQCPSPTLVVHLVQVPRQFSKLASGYESYEHERSFKRNAEAALRGDDPPQVSMAIRTLQRSLEETAALVDMAAEDCLAARRSIDEKLNGS